MNKNAVAAAFLLAVSGLSGPAEAVNWNPNGLGHVLLYPYYTVNKGQDTLFTIGNASSHSIAARVRFLEGYNSRPVLDLNVFLAPYDVWTGTVTQAADGIGSVLKSGDATCTDPAIPGSGLPLRTSAFDGTALPADGGPRTATRTREGSVEVIAGGILDGVADVAARSHRHDPAGPGQDPYLTCADVPAAMFTGMRAAPGALYGSGGIIDVREGTYYVYNAEALNGAVGVPLMTPADGPLDPSLERFAVVTGSTANFLSATGTPVSLKYDRPIDAVSAVLSAETLLNEYVVSSSLGASTDWIVAFPTKRYYTDAYVSGSNAARGPFPEMFRSPGVAPVRVDLGPAANVDRDGEACAADYCLYGTPFHLDYAVNAIALVKPEGVGHPSGVFGSKLAAYMYPFAEAGVLQLSLPGAPAAIPPTGAMVGTDLGPQHRGAVRVGGLPVIGFVAYNLINANAVPGRLANYSAVFRHRAMTSACYGTSEFDFGCF